MKYIRNAWYPTAWSRDIGRSLTRRTILEENVVLYRKERGAVAALEDVCPHRFTPLSIGRLKGDAVECGYHGITFDCAGKCIRVPGQERIPPSLVVRSYPVAESLGVVWLWMGDPALASTNKPFDFAQYHDPAWSVAHGDALRIEANYLNLADNLTDPAHVSFVHQGTLGDKSSEDVPVTVDTSGNSVVVGRYILDSPPLPLVQKLGSFKGKVDRWHYYYYYPPTTVIIDFGTMPAGTGAPQGKRENSFRFFAGHFLTPVDQNTTIDHWLWVRNFRINDPAIDEAMREQLRIAFAEDKAILEAVWKQELRYSDRRMVRLAIDSAPVRMRRIVQDLIDQENAKSARELITPAT